MYDYVTILRVWFNSVWFNLGLFLKMHRDSRILKLTLLLEESKAPSRPGRFCFLFTDAKPASEMHMRRNHLLGDGRKNCG